MHEWISSGYSSTHRENDRRLNVTQLEQVKHNLTQIAYEIDAELKRARYREGERERVTHTSYGINTLVSN